MEFIFVLPHLAWMDVGSFTCTGFLFFGGQALQSDKVICDNGIMCRPSGVKAYLHVEGAFQRRFHCVHAWEAGEKDI